MTRGAGVHPATHLASEHCDDIRPSPACVVAPTPAESGAAETVKSSTAAYDCEATRARFWSVQGLDAPSEGNSEDSLGSRTVELRASRDKKSPKSAHTRCILSASRGTCFPLTPPHV